MQTQSLRSKLGEVKYRSKVSLQHLGKENSLPNEPSSAEFATILKSRLAKYQNTFKDLRKKTLLNSPFLEIGAEYCLASILLVNNFDMRGIASDISPTSLASAPKFAQKFGFKKLPKIACIDAYNLPFKSNSFPFVFIYETLHHFPDPKPILQEIYRVLAPGGCLLIGADPIRQTFQIKLWRRPTKLRPFEKILKAIGILPFISHIGKTEVNHGIIEDAFTLKTWQKALSIFEKVEVTITTPIFGQISKQRKSNSDNWLSLTLPKNLLIYFFGGGLEALCQKKGAGKITKGALENAFVCPDCKIRKNQENSLVKNGQKYLCPSCQTVFTKKREILFLLESNLKNKILLR